MDELTILKAEWFDIEMQRKAWEERQKPVMARIAQLMQEQTAKEQVKPTGGVVETKAEVPAA